MYKGTGAESLGNLWEEGSVFLREGMLKIFRLKYRLSWLVLMELNYVVDQKYVNICNDSKAALKVPPAVIKTSPLVQQRQRALNVISTQHTVGLHWVPG
jgi:hypothetical protein